MIYYLYNPLSKGGKGESRQKSMKEKAKKLNVFLF